MTPILSQSNVRLILLGNPRFFGQSRPRCDLRQLGLYDQSRKFARGKTRESIESFRCLQTEGALEVGKRYLAQSATKCLHQEMDAPKGDSMYVDNDPMTTFEQ